MKLQTFLAAALSCFVAVQGASVEKCTVANLIAPTYDDGPSVITTPALLTNLKTLDARLTFFIVGQQLEDDNAPAILKNMDAAGHHIAIHTYTHPDLETLNKAQIATEVIKTSDKINSIIGK